MLTQALLEDPEISDGNSASSALIGSLSSASMLAFSSLAGPLVRRYGARAVTATGAVLTGLGLAAASAAPTLPLLTAAYGGIAGVGFSLAWAPSVVVVGAYFTGARRAVATGLAVSGSGVGTVVLAQVLLPCLLVRHAALQARWQGHRTGPPAKPAPQERAPTQAPTPQPPPPRPHDRRSPFRRGGPGAGLRPADGALRLAAEPAPPLRRIHPRQPPRRLHLPPSRRRQRCPK